MLSQPRCSLGPRDARSAAFVLSLVLGLGLALFWPAAWSVAQARAISVAIVWRVSPPAYADPSVQAASVALRAPTDIGDILKSMRAHPGVRFALAVDPDYLDGLARAAAGSTALRELAAGAVAPSDPRAVALLEDLTAQPPVTDEVARTAVGRRLRALIAAAPMAIANPSTLVSHRDLIDLAGAASLVWLNAAGLESSNEAALNRSTIDARSAVAELTRANADVLRELRTATQNGTLELIAQPAGDAVLPLIVDSAGKSSLDPNIIDVKASADAGQLATDAMSAVRRIAPSASAVGVYSPYGAYDDATAQLLGQRGAGYALFSDRALHAGGAGTSLESLDATESAAFHAYSLRVSTTGATRALFWSQDDSDALSSTPVSWPPRAMARRIETAARRAAVAASDAQVIVLTIDADGAWGARHDRRAAVEAIAATLADHPDIHAVTPGDFIRSHSDVAAAYGFAPATSAGSFALWMGSTTQAALWSALVAAREAAGGEKALERPGSRAPLLAAESSRWYAAMSLPQSDAAVKRRLAEFRALLAEIYRAAGRSVPAKLVEVKIQAAPVLATPAP